jgi:hypothetical protein
MAKFKQGFFLAPNIYVDENGSLYRDTEQDGLGVNWEKIGTYFAPFVAAGAGWIAAKGGGQQQQQYPVGQPQGVYAGANNQSLFAGIDTTTLLLIGGAALLFFSMPAKR